MIITDLTTFLVPPRWLFLRVRTSDGIVGWGEPIVEGRAETVATAVSELSDYLVGRDPLLREDHWQVLTKSGFYRGGPILSSAVAGIDQALWDIAGKTLERPIYDLLGGPVRERVRMYSEVDGETSDALEEATVRRIEEGFTAVKFNASNALASIDTLEELNRIVDRAEHVRGVLGPGRDLAVDFHGRSSPQMAHRVLRALEPVAPLFVEEPVLPEYGATLPSLVASTTIPIATGERLYSRWDFKPVLEAGVAVVQPDLSHAGGISEVRRIASLAEVYGALVAPHCPLGPIALAACLQIAFSIPNFLIQEQSLGMEYHKDVGYLDYLVDRSVLSFEDGYVSRPRAPGLGIEVDEAAVERAAAVGHRWRPPVLRLGDGSFAEW